MASNGSGPGGLNATISEARLFDTALSLSEVQALTLTTVPEPGSLALAGLAALAGLRKRTRK